MDSKSIKELRQVAKTLGVKGYSRMTRSELERELKIKNGPAVRSVTPAAPPSTDPPAKSSDTTRWEEPARQHGPKDAHFASQEERVESAKYHQHSHGAAVARAPNPLGENIDQLPPLRDPMLCVLPQKPGILHAYWVLPGQAPNAKLMLRLCRIGPQSLDVEQEVELPAERGVWYFHVPETFDNDAALVQLGEYRGGEFVATMSRSVTRAPSRYASNRTDQAWWINEDDFRRMYQRTGGATQAARHVWNNSTSSPGAAAPGEGRPEWPGGVSSPTK